MVITANSVGGNNVDEQVRKYHGANSADLWVCIYPDVQPVSGVLLMPCIDVPIPFEGLDDLILRANAVFDAIEFPMRFLKRRSISKKPLPIPEWISEHLREPLSPLALEQRVALYSRENMRKFFIRVRCRQHASWQGDFTDCSRKRSRHFRSALELMEMLSEVCCGNKA